MVPNDVAPKPAPAVSGQFRAYWADAFGEGIADQAQIDDLVSATADAHLNAIVAQVVRRGDCFCLRAAVPRTEVDTAPPPFDPLDALIKTAHARGIEVHAWIIATAMWNSPTPPRDPAHVFNLHGPTASGRDNWLNVRADGLVKMNDDWLLDPGHPDAAAWIVNVATSVVRNYDVDGINLDRIRYPDLNFGTNVPSWGYNPTAVARFRAETGRTDPLSNTDPQWTQWRRDQVTGIVRRIYLETTALKPNLRVSADLITYGNGPQRLGSFEATRPYAEQLQDWRGWLREGIIDTAILMNYKRDTIVAEPGNQRRMYDEWNEFAKDNQYRRSTAVGTALYLNDIASSVQQVRRAIAPSAAGNVGLGWVGYSYRNPDNLATADIRAGSESRAELISQLVGAAGAPFAGETPPVPAMSWKTKPVFGHLRGSAIDAEGWPLAGVTVRAIDVASGLEVRSVTTDGSGWFGFVDLMPGTYRVITDAANAPSPGLGEATVTPGLVSAPGLAPPVQPPGTQPAPSAPPEPSAAPRPRGPNCASASTGPGIPPPPVVPSGMAGFHASWYGQSGYPTLCPGDSALAIVAFYNSGTRGWSMGRMGEVAYLGTWNPDPGQDRPSALGGDGDRGSPATGWPRYNRVAVQPTTWVGPNQVAWFQFTIVAPSTPGTYRLAIRPLIEGAHWMEDYGVFWYVTVRAPQ